MSDPIIINEQPGGSADDYQSSSSASANTSQPVAEEKIGQFTIRPTTVVLLVILAIVAIGVGWFIYNQLYAPVEIF